MTFDLCDDPGGKDQGGGCASKSSFYCGSLTSEMWFLCVGCLLECTTRLWQPHQSVSQQVINLKWGHEKILCSITQFNGNTHTDRGSCDVMYVWQLLFVCVFVMNQRWICLEKPQVIVTWDSGEFTPLSFPVSAVLVSSSIILINSVNHHHIVSATDAPLV